MPSLSSLTPFCSSEKQAQNEREDVEEVVHGKSARTYSRFVNEAKVVAIEHGSASKSSLAAIDPDHLGGGRWIGSWCGCNRTHRWLFGRPERPPKKYRKFNIRTELNGAIYDKIQWPDCYYFHRETTHAQQGT